MSSPATIAAIATPPGRGGVGVVRLSGGEALSIALRLCARKEAPAPRRATLAWARDADGAPLDQGLLLYFPAPASFTGEEVVEFQGHGSPMALRAVLDRCLALGAAPAAPGEFSRRAVENGRMDLSCAEGIIACIDAVTTRAAKVAQRHLSGEFGRLIDSRMQDLLGIVAHAEACLDFPEEEIPPLFLKGLRQRLRQELVGPLRHMLRGADFGERLFQGATVAIVGAPNVGKSSLLNRLSGRDRAIVSARPGTTRDVLEVDFEVHGIPVRLLDTAGLRDSEDVIEQEGVARARRQAEMADLVLFVADASREETWQVELSSVDLRLMNKMDAMPADRSVPAGFLPLSARTGEGIEALLAAMARHLGEDAFSEETPLIIRARHRDAITRAIEAIEAADALLCAEDTLELATMQLRTAHAALAEITGHGDVEDILDRVFSEFCIGK